MNMIGTRMIWPALLLPLALAAQRTDRNLERKLHDLLDSFPAQCGLFVKNLHTGKVAEIRSDSLFPTASMIKVSLLIGVMDKIERGQLDYHQVMIYSDSLLYPGVDILGSFKSGEKIELSKLLMLMLSMSDNTASLWLQSLAGGGLRVNELLDSLGFRQTRVNSRTPGREANREQYGWGQTTPREMARLMELIYEGRVISPFASDRMLRLLGRNYWDEAGPSQIPPNVFVASKNGALDYYRSETMLVMAPHGPYICSLICNNLRDSSWNQDNAAWVMCRKVSRLLWNYFEPRSAWSPVTGLEGKRE
jgi:beta-lactamase class A